MNMSENLLGIFPKLIPRNIHSKTTSYICMEILLGTNAECTRNFFGFFPLEKKLNPKAGFRSELFAFRVNLFFFHQTV
jgi:hypothetical protein